MNVKKTVLSVILGVALVSFITAAIALLVSMFQTLIDYASANHIDSDYQYIVGVMQIFLFLIALGFTLGIIFAKKKRKKLSIIFSAVSAGFLLSSTVALRICIEGYTSYSNDYFLNQYEYNLFTTYLTGALSLVISVVIATVAYIMLLRIAAKEGAAHEPASIPTEIPESNVQSEQKTAVSAPAPKTVDTKDQEFAFCSQCGKKHAVGVKFCGGCGHKLV